MNPPVNSTFPPVVPSGLPSLCPNRSNPSNAVQLNVRSKRPEVKIAAGIKSKGDMNYVSKGESVAVVEPDTADMEDESVAVVEPDTADMEDESVTVVEPDTTDMEGGSAVASTHATSIERTIVEFIKARKIQLEALFPPLLRVVDDGQKFWETCKSKILPWLWVATLIAAVPGVFFTRVGKNITDMASKSSISVEVPLGISVGGVVNLSIIKVVISMTGIPMLTPFVLGVMLLMMIMSAKPN